MTPTYRYRLERDVAPLTGKGTVLFVMLNPSVADDTVDDPTIRRCVRFAEAWGFRRLLVGNLFAMRATDPAELAGAADPVGPGNDVTLHALCEEADSVVCAWGAHKLARDRGRMFIREAVERLERDRRFLQACLGTDGPRIESTRERSFEPLCLGLTLSGDPRHPLYVPSRQVPIPFLAGTGAG